LNVTQIAFSQRLGHIGCASASHLLLTRAVSLSLCQTRFFVLYRLPFDTPRG
jgi:hypothetical protein